MYRIILYSAISDLLKKVNPFDYFGKEVSEDYFFPTFPGVVPSFLNAFYSRLFGEAV